MHVNLRNTVWLLLLGGAAVGTWLLIRKPPAEIEVARSPSITSLGYYLKEAVIVGTDTDGEVLYRIAASRVEESPDTEQLRLDDVEVAYRNDRGIPWRIQATSARGPTNRAYLDLSGSVRIERTDTDGEEPTVIETSELHLVPEEYFASTDAAVRFVVGDTSIDAVGLKAYLKDDKIDLESKIHAEIPQ